MGPRSDREIAGETTRVDAVRYLQGALGHATGGLLSLLAGGLAWIGGYRTAGVVLVAITGLLSANGLSIWAWTRLVAYFTARADRSGDETATRTLRAEPLSIESWAEMQAGAVMMLCFVVVLLAGRVGLGLLAPRQFAYVCVGCLAVGNVVALAWARDRDR